MSHFLPVETLVIQYEAVSYGLQEIGMAVGSVWKTAFVHKDEIIAVSPCDAQGKEYHGPDDEPACFLILKSGLALRVRGMPQDYINQTSFKLMG